jgi:AcrR family transcriptional regulator
MPGQEEHEGVVDVDHATRRRRPPLVTREKVVEVAYGLVVDDGPDGLSMRKLAAALHVSLPTVYTAIRSREFLVQQLQNRLFEDIAAVLAAADTATTHGDRLTVMAGTFLDWAAANPQLAEFLLSEEFSAEVAERVTQPGQHASEGVAYVIGLCRELAQQGQLPKVNPLVGVAFAFAQTRALLSLMRDSAFASVRADTWLGVARSTVVCGLEALARA